MLHGILLKKFDSLVESFSAGDRIAIAHDLDADGVSSGVIAYYAVKKLRKRAPELLVTQRFKTVELLPESLEKLGEKKINKLIVTDFALDQKPVAARKAEGIVEQIIVIDHHTDYNYKSEKTFIIKPQFVSDIEPSRYPTAKFAYDLFSRHIDLSHVSWIACVGLMGDNQLEQWRGFVEESCKRHNTSVRELWMVMEIISSVEVLAPKKLNELALLLAASSSPNRIIGSKFAFYSKKLSVEVERLFKEFVRKKEVFGGQNAVWFYFKSKHNIKSAVINKASNELYPNRTLVFVQDKGDGYVSFSARNQGFKVKTNQILEKAILGFADAGAGGHVPASAGRIRKEDLPEFKKRVLEMLGA